ncbi:MAG: histidine phosphatase family protein [Alphaproteobacteria bacterium]|nr:histidine phosphatase family protein [Alphaproteobacteria bacterium]
MSVRFEFGAATFYFLRHGETDANKNGIVQGQQDTPLNARGRRSAEEAGLRLMPVGLGSIYASPLKRAWQTATIVSRLTGAPVHPLPGLKERHWGIYEGRRKSMRPREPDPPSVERMAAFKSRVLGALRTIVGPPPVLVVAHSGVFRVLCAEIGLEITTPYSVASTQLLRLEPPGTDHRWHITEV